MHTIPRFVVPASSSILGRMPYDTLPPAFWLGAAALFGLIVGSFLNVVIHRWPREESIVLPASHCGSCGAPVKPYDNIPIVSYLVLGGKCRSCRARISPRYLAVEALTGGLFVAAFLARGPGLAAVFDCVFLAMLVPLVFIDAEWHLLPNVITHPGLVFALVARIFAPNLFGVQTTIGGGGWLLGLSASPTWFVSLVGAAAGAALGGGLLFALGVLYRLVRKREGMGLGDVSMMCMVGAYLGWELTLLTILLASVIGSVVGLALARGRRLDEFPIPFGVFLGTGAAVALLVGTRIVDWYVGLSQ
jgi:leader peptidase (prepilin peptidase)/N-methyltransferase